MLPVALMAALMLAVACQSDRVIPDPEPPSRRVLAVNQGLELNDFATLTEFVVDDNLIERNVYQKVNKNFIGTRFTDLMVEDREAFFVLNGNNRIAVLDPNTYQLQRIISNLDDPRNIMRVRPGVAYVSSWNENGVYRINTEKGNVQEIIRTGTAPGEMTLYEDWVLIPNTGGVGIDSTVMIRSASTDTLVDTLFVGYKPNSIQISEQNILYILCAGADNPVNPTLSIPGTLWKFHLDSVKMAIDSGYAIEAFDTLVYSDANLNPYRLRLSEPSGRLYFMDQAENANIMAMDTSTSSLPLVPFFSGSYDYYELDRKRLEIYLVNDGPGNQGEVFRFSEAGDLLNQFVSGNRPRGFHFE